MKTFTTAGVSKLAGKFNLRATNREGDTYSDILKKEGHTDVHMVHLKHSMNKDEIRKYLPTLKAFQTAEILACLRDVENPADAKASKAAKDKEKVVKLHVKNAKAPPKKKPIKKPKDEPVTDGSEVATTEAPEDEDVVNVGEEMGEPAFARHVTADED